MRFPGFFPGISSPHRLMITISPVGKIRSWAVVFTVGLSPLLWADPEIMSPKIFIGSDLEVKWQEDFVDVANFKGSHVVVHDSEANPVVLTKANEYRWKRRMKVSRAPVTIENLDHRRLYSVNRDPTMRQAAVQITMTEQQATKQDIAVGEMVAVSSGQGPSQATMNRLYNVSPGRTSGMHVPDHGQYSEDLRQGIVTLEQVGNAAAEVMNQTFDQGLYQPDQEFYQKRRQTDDEDEGFDRVEMKFDIASSEAIADAHAVVRATVTTPDSLEGSVMVLHQRIGKLDAKPRRITVRKAGLPAGFKLEEIQVEVYSRGCEIGSNLSERSREVSIDEARGFLLLAHMADFHGESISSRPVWDLAPPELWSASESDLFDYPVFVSLDEFGRILGIHQTIGQARDSLEIIDASEIRAKNTGAVFSELESFQGQEITTELDQSGQLPRELVSIVGRMMFMPALENGIPVPSALSVNLADFIR